MPTRFFFAFGSLLMTASSVAFASDCAPPPMLRQLAGQDHDTSDFLDMFTVTHAQREDSISLRIAIVRDCVAQTISRERYRLPIAMRDRQFIVADITDSTDTPFPAGPVQ